MKIIKGIKNFFSKLLCHYKCRNKEETLQRQVCEDVFTDIPLSTDNITFEFCTIRNLFDREYLSLISDELNIPVSKIEGEFHKMTEGLRTDLSCCIEYPYVDMYYRDTYYNYYAKKHSDYNRYCFRISFFDRDVTYVNFHTIENLSEKFYGYIVLRPTKKRATGYSFLSPKAYVDHNFSCCVYKRKASIYGRKLSVFGFPFCGQDGEMITCAETSLMVMVDYFSHKYSKYREILPSDIIQLLSKQKTERQLPSRGLPSELISHILSTLGLGIRIYYRKNDNGDDAYSEKEFKEWLYAYIESGLPIQISTKEHSFLIIGKENKLGTRNVKLVTIDDNKRPYKLIDFNEEILSFSVPLYEKIYLEVDVIDIKAVQEILEENFQDINTHIGESGYLLRRFITSSRSYKNYISKMSNLVSREHFLCKAMPRFIWVYEIIKESDVQQEIEKTFVSSVFLFDATEGKETMNNFIMAKVGDCIILKTTDYSMYKRTIYKKFEGNTETFTIFADNLKGDYNQWQE